MSSQHLRQSFLGQNSEVLIRNARVAIVGLCGGGSHVAQQLAHIGIRRFYLFDHDQAEEHNINRMVSLTRKAARAGKAKVDAIERLIKGINPDAKVIKVQKLWQESPELLKGCTAIFGCVDNYSARDELERHARRYLIPYIDVGMDVSGKDKNFFITGQIILSLPGQACMRCMGFITDQHLKEEANRYGQAGGRPQVIWPNGVLASTAVGHFMSILTPWNENLKPALYTEYDGNRRLLFASNRLSAIDEYNCNHYGGPNTLGDVVF